MSTCHEPYTSLGQMSCDWSGRAAVCVLGGELTLVGRDFC